VRRICSIILVFLFLASFVLPPAEAASLASEMLYQGGVKLYKQGRYDEALSEFRKALLAEPGYQPALDYISKIEDELKARDKELPRLKDIPQASAVSSYLAPQRPEDIISDLVNNKEEALTQKAEAEAPQQPRASTSKRVARPSPIEKKAVLDEAHAGAIEEAFNLMEFVNEMIAQQELYARAEGTGAGKAEIPAILALDDSFKTVSQPVEIEQGKSIIIRGSNIQRFLVTQPEIIEVVKNNSDELSVTANEIGYSYLHIWDDNGRWTSEFLTVYPKPEGPMYEETLRRSEEEGHSFKLGYELSWSSFESGRRMDELDRSSYSWNHKLTLSGQTPYGDFDSGMNIRSLNATTDLTYINMALLNGKYGPFEGFTFRAFDYGIPVNNLAVSNVSLRGLMFQSPAFNKKVDYAVFWGREGGGRYGNLSPGLTKIQDSFISGMDVGYAPDNKSSYRFTIAHGWGRDRGDDLRPYGYDLTSSWKIGEKWDVDYDIGYDSKRVAQTFDLKYSGGPKFNLTSQLRNIDRDFYTMTGRGWRAGEIGGNINLSSRLTDRADTSFALDVYQDRLFPAEDDPHRLNENLTWNGSYKIDDFTSLNLNYNLQNQLGTVSQYRYQVGNFGLNRRFEWIRNIYASLNYYYQKNESYTSPSSSYTNNKLAFGANFNIIGNLNYYVNKEFNWLLEQESGTRGTPNVLDTGLDWSGQLLATKPLFASISFSYRDEENADTPLSFLAGQDYINGYVQVSYRPSDNKEIYGSANVRNYWADKEGAGKRIDASFNAGLRYLWDTGIRWDSVGNVEGYVFKDLNSDGLRQRDEAPVSGIKIWLGKDKYQLTDTFGFYSFKNVKARKGYVTLDTSTLPQGFVVTVPVTQEVAITHHKTSQANFGIISRTEISGLVFEDKNENGEYDRDDKGVEGVVVTLEDGTQAVTDGSGKYTFSHVSTGAHTITLGLDSIPVYYLPETTLTKDIVIYEGVSYVYNIPLKRVQE